jgi:hypothetical protein
MAADDISRLYTFVAGAAIDPTHHNAEHNLFITTLNSKFGRDVANTCSGNNTFSGSNTFSSTNTFSGANTHSSTETFSHATGVTTDTVTERTTAAGVTIDSVLLKDGYVKVGSAGYTPAANGELGYDSTAHLYEGYQNGQVISLVPAMVLLSTQTASASATIDFTSFINSSIYDSYEIRITDFVPATESGSADLIVQVSIDDGANWITSANQYHRVKDEIGSGSGTSGISASQTATSMMLAAGVGNATGEGVCGVLQVLNPSGSRYKLFTFEGVFMADTGNLVQVNTASGYVGATTAINGIRLSFDNGNVTSGTARLYGVRK